MCAKYKPSFYLCSVLLVCFSQAATSSRAECYSTPQAAVDEAGSSHSLMLETAGGGYRVVRVESDPLLRRSWAMVASCAHPDWSMLLLPVSVAQPLKLTKARQAGPELPIVVHAGDPVRLWRREALLQVQTAGICKQNGRLGEIVRVRLFQRHNDNLTPPEELTGVVQGPSDVEMRP